VEDDNKATPRSFENPDAAEFTRRHAVFYDYHTRGMEGEATRAFAGLRSWAWSRCSKNPDFMKKWSTRLPHRQEGDPPNKALTIDEMDLFATEMKVVWHDAGLWDYGQTPQDLEEVIVNDLPYVEPDASAPPAAGTE